MKQKIASTYAYLINGLNKMHKKMERDRRKATYQYYKSRKKSIRIWYFGISILWVMSLWYIYLYINKPSIINMILLIIFISLCIFNTQQIKPMQKHLERAKKEWKEAIVESLE